MNELKNVSGIDAAVSALIADLDERAAEAINHLSSLVNIVTTPDNIIERKADRATINKTKKEFDDERKKIEKEWKAAIAPVSDAYKYIGLRCDLMIAAIDKDLSELEDRRIEEKRRLIREIWERAEVPEGLEDWFDLEDVLNPKWLNATYKASQIEKDIEDAYTVTKLSLDTIKSLNHDWEIVGIAELKKTGSLKSAIDKMNEMAENSKLMNEALEASEVHNSTDQTTERPQTASRGQIQGDKMAVYVLVEPERLDELKSILDFAGFEWRM